MFLKPEYKNEKAYAKYVDESGVFSNKLCNALPQTVIAKAVKTHMEGVGKTKKKLPLSALTVQERTALCP